MRFIRIKTVSNKTEKYFPRLCVHLFDLIYLLWAFLLYAPFPIIASSLLQAVHCTVQPQFIGYLHMPSGYRLRMDSLLLKFLCCLNFARASPQ